MTWDQSADTEESRDPREQMQEHRPTTSEGKKTDSNTQGLMNK